MYYTRITLSVIFIFVLIRRGDAIKCYVCNSHMNQSCGGNVDTNTISGRECSREYSLPENADFICQKIELNDLEGNHVIMRGCSIQAPGSNPCDIASSIAALTDGAAKLKSCVTCAHDFCNN